MSVINLENISKTYVSKAVLRNVNLRLDHGDRLGLIGHNGSGKTTLLRIITGIEEADGENSKVEIAGSSIMRYLTQEFDDSLDTHSALENPELQDLFLQLEELSLQMEEEPENEKLLAKYSELQAKFSAKGAWDYSHRLAEAAAGLGLDMEKIRRSRGSLSGGERMRLSLASMLVEDADLLLLDEPTNHLDVEASEWLETYLASFKGCLIVISHDRKFLDAVCNKIAELNNGKLEIYPGNYSHFKGIQAEVRYHKQREEEKLRKEISREEEIVQTLYSHRNISAYHSRQKKLHKLKDSLENLKNENKVIQPKFKLKALADPELGTTKRLLISARDLSIQFPDSDKPLFTPFDFDLRSRDRVLFCGPNGCGKSNLLKALAAQNPYMEGEIRIVSDIRFATLQQWQRFGNPEQTVVDCLRSYDEHLTFGQAREILASYSFFDTDLVRSLHTLSGGEKSRLALACILLKKPDILFLDEPTNHLDIESVEILEEALLQYSGTIVAVSHDRYFIDNIAKTVWGFVDGSFREFPKYSSYRNAVKAARLAKQNEANPLRDEDNFSQESFDFSAEEIKLWPSLKELPGKIKSSKDERRFRAKLGEIFRDVEKEISLLDNEIQEMEASFGTDDSAELYTKYGQKQIRQEKLFELLIKLEVMREENAKN